MPGGRWASDEDSQHSRRPYVIIRRNGTERRQGRNAGLLWLSKCNLEHGTHCQSVVTSDPSQNLSYFVDVKEEKLVLVSPNVQYAALSYVWGSVSQLELTRRNAKSLQEPGSLRTTPKTIRDAMLFCRKEIDVPYLWVDALCIVQDDLEHKSAAIQSMASIYANAYVTLVAACGKNVNSGLLSESRTSFWDIDNSTKTKVLDNPGKMHDKLLRETTWLRRGWTLQELVFSQRAIFFFENEVTWECHCAVWHSEIKLRRRREPCGMRYSNSLRGLQHSDWPNLEEYAKVVLNYASRELTFETDVLHAFAGVTNTLSGVFSGGFIYGLPQMFFDAALLWQPKSSRFTRREHSECPSWSWMGWKGDLDLNGWRGGFDYVAWLENQAQRPWRRPSTCSTIPVVSWFTKSGSGSEVERQALTNSVSSLAQSRPHTRPRRINNWSGEGSYSVELTYRVVSRLKPVEANTQIEPEEQHALELSAALYIFTKFEIETESRHSNHSHFDYNRSGQYVEGGSASLKPDDRQVLVTNAFSSNYKSYAYADKYLYTVGIDHSVLFRYPIPIITDQTDVDIPQQRQFICTTTSRAFLRTRERRGSRCWVDIVDQDNSMIGILRLHNYPMRLEALLTRHRASRLELILISEGRALNDVDESHVFEEWDDRPHKNRRSVPYYEFYHVLWISRGENGVAYREGLGRVFKDAWWKQVRKHDREIDVTLG